MKKTVLNEGTKEFKELKKKWLEFKPKNEKELFSFIHKLTTEYVHDYGTCVHSCVALMKAILEYCNLLEGFTGFQVSCMMWEAIKYVFGREDEIGMRLVSYKNILYPQNLDVFENNITEDQHNKIIKKAQSLLDEREVFAHPDVVAHWKKLVNGWLPDNIHVKEE